MPDLHLAAVIVGQEMPATHWIVYDAYRRAHGMCPWNVVQGGLPTAAMVNQAVGWWNAWQREWSGLV